MEPNYFEEGMALGSAVALVGGIVLAVTVSPYFFILAFVGFIFFGAFNG